MRLGRRRARSSLSAADSKERQTSVLDECTCAGKCNRILRCHYDVHRPGRLPATCHARNINVASILLCIHTTDSPLPLTRPLRSCVHGGASAMYQNMQINVGMNANKQRYQQAILWLLSRSLHARQPRRVRKHINRRFCIRGKRRRALHNTAALCRAKRIDERDKSSGAGCG